MIPGSMLCMWKANVSRSLGPWIDTKDGAGMSHSFSLINVTNVAGLFWGTESLSRSEELVPMSDF